MRINPTYQQIALCYNSYQVYIILMRQPRLWEWKICVNPCNLWWKVTIFAHCKVKNNKICKAENNKITLYNGKEIQKNHRHIGAAVCERSCPYRSPSGCIRAGRYLCALSASEKRRCIFNDPTKGYGIFVEEMTANKIGQKT